MCIWMIEHQYTREDLERRLNIAAVDLRSRGSEGHSAPEAMGYFMFSSSEMPLNGFIMLIHVVHLEYVIIIYIRT